MNYLSMMTIDEIKYICSVIPHQEIVGYFKHYPKHFYKIMPGFRATSLNQEKASAVLFKNRNNQFVETFIEKHISRWLDQIQSEIKSLIHEGENKEFAWLQTLPFCFFADDINIYFKLVGEKLSDECSSLLDASIKIIKNLDISNTNLKSKLSEKESIQACIEKKNKNIQEDLDKSNKKLLEYSSEIKALKHVKTEIEKIEDAVCLRDKGIKTMKNMMQEREILIQNLKDELSAVKKEQQKIEIKIREEIEKQQVSKLIEQSAFLNPKCPADINEYKDYLGFNLENIGIKTDEEYYPLLKDYLCKILFTGKPILVSRNTGKSLMRCVGNSLVGSENIATLIFNSELSEQTINGFLSATNRIFCLDNFIGNFNETILSTICDKHKDKIIFLTNAYEKTLNYVPQEFLKYCHYININRIDAFSHYCELSEDPSLLEEVEVSSLALKTDKLWMNFLKDMLNEIGVNNSLSAYKSMLISDEASLWQLLAFDILPYCTDVLNISPFSVSERFNKYAGDKGRCSYKELFRRWFA